MIPPTPLHSPLTLVDADRAVVFGFGFSRRFQRKFRADRLRRTRKGSVHRRRRGRGDTGRARRRRRRRRMRILKKRRGRARRRGKMRLRRRRKIRSRSAGRRALTFRCRSVVVVVIATSSASRPHPRRRCSQFKVSFGPPTQVVVGRLQRMNVQGRIQVVFSGFISRRVGSVGRLRHGEEGRERKRGREEELGEGGKTRERDEMSERQSTNHHY